MNAEPKTLTSNSWLQKWKKQANLAVERGSSGMSKVSNDYFIDYYKHVTFS